MHLQDLCALLRAGWRDLDTTNLALTLQQLTLLAQQAPGGAAAFTTALHADSIWPWLLAQVASAAAAPDFLNWHASSVLWAVCKLHGATHSTLHALHAPLARALATAARNGGSAGASSLPTDSLLQVLWAFAVEPRLQPMLQQLKPKLFAAMWVAAPHLASQVTTVGKGGARDWSRVTRQLLLPPPWHIAAAHELATAWWSLAEMSSHSRLQGPDLGAEVPALLDRLSQAAAAAATSFAFDEIAQLLQACASMHPEPYHNDELLHALATAADDRLRSDAEPPVLQAVAAICLSFGRLDFLPRRRWCAEVCDYLQGLCLLDHPPSAALLGALLVHLATPGSTSTNSGISMEGEEVDSLVELVTSLRCILLGGRYTESGFPQQMVSDCFDALDTVLTVRLALSSEVGGHCPPHHLLLTAPLVGALCGELAKLASVPGAALTQASVKELERHILHTAPSYSATDLARVLHYYAAQGLQPGQHATKAVGERLLTLLSKQHGAEAGSVLLPPGFAPRQPCTALPPGFAPQQQGMPLRTLGKLLHLLASLRLEHRGLLPSLLAATWTALEVQEQEIQQGKEAPPTLRRELVVVASGLGGLRESGLLQRERLPAAAVLPLWRGLMAWLAFLPPAGMASLDGAILQQAADQLNQGLAVGSPMFVPPHVGAGHHLLTA
ncbi:hypothetical protein D9Q98_003178 [Chlorella vulgaris]|uniref:Uncharacterized protein n=1 Tax=Chlorella vulgaris TaxID=3077 RepID=A0A9D4TTG7_CHLVU|nr:hypothetical protein D9Q98_003178 [Chlorella vulgaris]